MTIVLHRNAWTSLDDADRLREEEDGEARHHGA
jgi:hypothetical protein